MKQIPPVLGQGIYRISDVSRFTRVAASTVRSWFKGGAGFATVLQSDYLPVDGVYSVSFHDLIDALVAGQFRKLGVTMKVVRQSYRRLAVKLDTEHPFCHRGLYSNGQRIIAETSEGLGRNLEDAINNQQWFGELRDHLAKIEYSRWTEVAERWKPHHNVVLDPALAMGLPVVEGTGTTTYVVRASYYANGEDAGFVADAFGITTEKVRDAVLYENGLSVRKVA